MSGRVKEPRLYRFGFDSHIRRDVGNCNWTPLTRRKMTQEENKNWALDGDQLFLTAGGEIYYASANEIYGCVLEQKQVFADVQPGPPANLNALSFSKYPVELILTVDHRPAESGTGLYCSVAANRGNDAAAIDRFRARKSDHVVIQGKWYPFTPGATDELLAILDEADIGETGEITFRQYMHLKRVAKENSLVRDETADRVVHPGITTSPGKEALRLFEGSLYPYQEDGWRWLSFICRQELGGVLADEMGLGKTVQIITVLAHPDRDTVVPSLIVAPSTLLENWRREIARFAPSLKTCVHQGAGRTGLPATLRDNDVVIASYDTVVRDGALFDMIGWKIAVLDEAQAIKNPETRRATAVKRLSRTVSIAVTGTPVENRLRDLWSIVDFVLPDYLGSENDFEKAFGDGLDGGVAVEPYVSPIMLRRRVIEVAKDLPERIDVPQVLMLEDHEIAEYERVRQETLDEYGKAASLVSLTRLRMFCTHPWLLTEERPDSGDPKSYGKFRRLVEILEEIFGNGEKVLVFTSYNGMSDIIVEEVRKSFGVFAESIDGRTPIPERQDVIDRFSEVGGAALLSLNPRAAGVGLNITAANHVIHYTLEWNPAVEDQASARAYRRGQEKPVTVHRLYAANTVEEAIDQRLERKRQLADAAVVGVSGKGEEIDDIVRALQMSPAGRAQ